MKTVIIVSKCLRVTKINNFESRCEFHFKGVCAGEAVRKVVLRCLPSQEVVKNEEYLLYVNLVTFDAGVLNGTIVKAKLLRLCWDKS